MLFSGLAVAQDLRTQCGSSIKSHVEAIDSASHSYSIQMGGKIDGERTRDPIGYWAFDQYWEPNVSVRLENIGDTPVVNPWLHRAGSMDTRNLQSIVASIIQPGMSDKEKARRVYEFEVSHRFHATTQDDEVPDVVKRINIYGYSLCYDESKAISDLWRAAGLKVRQGYPNGHSLAEVYYEGNWHLLDSDESIISLQRDNETIVSEAQVVADHDLGKRTHNYGLLADDNRLGDEGGASLLFWEGPRSGEQPSLTRHAMDFTLRPGESITWAWNPANRYHAKPFSFGDEDADAWNKHWRVIAHVMDGEMTYAPDFSKASTLEYLHLEGVAKRSDGPYGEGLYLTGNAGAVGNKGVVDVRVKTAYPVVGGRVDVDFARQDLDHEGIALSISFDQGNSWTNVWASTPGDYNRMYADLDPFFKKTDAARYDYTLRFTLNSNAKTPAVALKGFYLRSTVQMAQLAMPGLALGENQFTYSDANSGTRQVRVTQTWNECDAAVGIPAVPVAVFPEDGKSVSGTQVTFQWKSAAGAVPADYEFELSEFSDMRWALSSNFHKLISRTPQRGTSSYQVPAVGLLNPDQTYYWRVRARSRDHVWGDWSRVYSFAAIAPAVPLNVAAQLDREHRAVRLEWKAGKGGTAAAYYRIFGSEERGFSASDHPYPYNAGVNGIATAPANLLLETGRLETGRLEAGHATQWTTIPQQLWRPYLRVVAVDGEGRESEASEMAELAHPLIVTRQLPAVQTHRLYQTRIETSASVGHLVSADEDGKPYQVRFRGGDDLAFTMTGAPEGLSINASGVISGMVRSSETRVYRLTIAVRDQTSGIGDSVQFQLAVEQ